MSGLLKDVTKSKGSPFIGEVLITSYAAHTKTNGELYVRGSFIDKSGAKGAFVKWDTVGFIDLPECFSCILDAKYDDYKGTIQYKVDGVREVNTNVNILDWKPRVITQEEGLPRLQDLLREHLTPMGQTFFKQAFSWPEFGSGKRFFTEPASLKVHDSDVGGLLHHALKTAEFAALVTTQHKEMFEDKHLKDVFILGCILHDWGKMLTHNIEDMENSLSPRIFLEHRYLFMEFLLVKHPNFLLEMGEYYGERLKDEFISIIMQHHGSYDERPRTMTAYLAHLVDYMETRVTIAMEQAKEGKNNLQLPNDISTRVDISLYNKSV